MSEAKLAFLRFLAVVERKTTNTVRFQEVTIPGEDEAVGYLYLKKKALAKIGNPNMVTITVEPGKGNHE